MVTTITIPADEFKEVDDLLHIISFDETKAIGQVHLQSDGKHRYWSTTDRVRAARLKGGPDTEIYSIGIPPLVFRSGHLIVNADEDIHIVIDDEHELLAVSCGEAVFTLPGLHTDFPDLDSKIPSDEHVAAHAQIRAKLLFDLITAAIHPREGFDDTSADDDPEFPFPFWLSIHNGRVGARVVWPNMGVTDLETAADEADGQRSIMVNPYLLKSLLQVFTGPEVLTMKIPTTTDYPLSLEASGKTSLLMPLQTRLCSSFEHVRKVLEEEFGYLASIFHEDGTCRITRRGSEVLGELIEDRGIPVFRVFCSLLDECEPTEELLRELNELNESSTFVRLFLKDGIVIAESDLVAERMDRHELRTATERILNVSQEVIPTLALVLGGRQFDDPLQKRLAKYRQTWVEAEVFPGECRRLNGDGAISDWPFPGPVHVLTSWNPEGVDISDDVAADINRKIASDVLSHGGRFVLAFGHTPQSACPEPSLVAWNLDRETALMISGKASRDAVLEISSDQVFLIADDGDIVEQWNRC